MELGILRGIIVTKFRLGLFIVGMLSATSALATSDYYDIYAKYYQLAEASPLATKQCANCHVSDEDYAMNPYGEAVTAAMKARGAEEMTTADLVSVESGDADKDGNPSATEIAAGTFPGDPASGAAAGVTAPPADEAPAKETSWFPKNSFHPAIVHMPIGLFIAGLLLDLLGLIRKDKTLLHAGWYNIVLATITSFGGIASGFMAMNMMGFPMKGHMLEHVVFTLIATVMMVGMIALRVHRHEKMNPLARGIYYFLAAGCLIILSWAGHMGGVLAGTA